jgi:hypothetical protein
VIEGSGRDKQGMNLKPCPFCGKEAKLKYTRYEYSDSYHITCGDLDCLGHNPYYPVLTNEAANEKNKQILIEKWNTRA